MSDTDTITPPRHVMWYKFAAFVIAHTLLPIAKKKLDIHAQRMKGKINEPSLIVYNHISDFDAIVVIASNPVHMRYVMSDRLIRKRVPRFLFKTITDGMYRTKGKNADNIVESCKLTIKRGLSVGMTPEGEESVDGCTHKVRGKTGQMVKDLGCDLVTYRVTGTYFCKPPYAKNKAKGPKFGELVAIYPKEKLSAMTSDEINEIISRDLYVNHYDWMKKNKIKYVREDPAESLDSVLYICPSCKSEGHMVCENDIFKCTDCGYSVKINDYNLFEGSNLIFDNLYDWYHWQEKEFVSCMERAIADGTPIAENSGMKLYIKDGEGAKFLEDDVSIVVTADSVCISGGSIEKRYDIDDVISITVPSSNGINLFVKDGYYVLKGTKSDCTRRYRTLFKLLKKYRSEHK